MPQKYLIELKLSTHGTRLINYDKCISNMDEALEFLEKFKKTFTRD